MKDQYLTPAPMAIQIELTEGCNLWCDGCGIKGIRERPGADYKFMDYATARAILEQLREWKDIDPSFNPRIEFAMHGEPSLHPHLSTMLAIFREFSTMMLTNGAWFVKGNFQEKITSVRNAGLNTLAFDDYEQFNLGKRIRCGLDAFRIPYGIFGATGSARSPHRRKNPNDPMEILIIEDIHGEKAGKGHDVLNSHCGAGGLPPKEVLRKRCAKPFREMSIRWNGSVAICCNDWRGEFPLPGETLFKKWFSERMTLARRALYWSNRDFGPCAKCDALSPRVGLLPDKLGKEQMLYPSAEDMHKLTEPMPPLTTPVARPWEV